MVSTLCILSVFFIKRGQFFCDIFRINLTLISLLFPFGSSYAQTIVGMGTENPNPNAVLELVAKNKNQGLLVPRLSTHDIISLAKNLNQKDNGLLVFVEDKGKFYYWWENKWHTLKPVDVLSEQDHIEYYIAGEGISIQNNTIHNTGDLDSTNELQSLSSVLRQGKDAEGQRIMNVADPIDAQDVATQNFVTNQLKSLSSPSLLYDSVTSSLSINGGNTVNLSGSFTNTDSQTLDFSGTTLSISRGNIIDLGTVVESSALPQGHLWVGNSSNHPIPLDAHSDGQILVGNGTTIASVTITGDLVLQADGTLTLKNTAVTTNKIADAAVTTAKIAEDAITRDKIHANIAGIGLHQAVDGSLGVANTGSGELLIGQGSTVSSQNISGDLSLSNSGDTKVTGLQGRTVSATEPGVNQVLTWNGSAWTPATSAGQQWYDGTATPNTTLPSGTSNGNYYYDTDDNKVYRKVNGNWTLLGGFNTTAPAAINTGGIADSYRAPVLYMGDERPVTGDDIGAFGDFYYSRDEGRLYYKAKNVGNGNIEWRNL